ncbi:MAG TPA: hypothetical protein PLB48_11350 [Treponema sp.]|nr:hypothetical protein [Treponema sp.]
MSLIQDYQIRMTRSPFIQAFDTYIEICGQASFAPHTETRQGDFAGQALTEFQDLLIKQSFIL